MKNILKLVQQNWKSGLTVSFVNIPLSLALAVASGATPTQGIITALWAGLIGAILGGCAFNIIGPTGALSGVLIGYALINGYTGLPFITILAGIFILIAYLLHLDKYIIFIPKSVIQGFTLGVAFIIGLNQINNALGLKNIPKTESIIDNVLISLQHFREIQWPVFLIFFLGLLFIFIWNKKIPKIPGAAVLAVIGIVGSLLLNKFNIGFSLDNLGQNYPDMKAQLFINIWEHFSWSMFIDKSMYIIAITIAVIAILETLISGQICNHMTQTKFNRKKEVFGLGMANIGSGLFGGIPATAALARTALNIKSGATDRTSAITSSFFLFMLTFILLPYFRWLPMVVVASILVFVSISMIERKHFIRLLDNEKTFFILSIVVAIITVAHDPIAGLLVGAIIALLIFVNKIAEGQTEILVWKGGKMVSAFLKKDYLQKHIESDMVVYKISGTLTYINMPAHLEAVGKIRGNKMVIISLRHAFYVDSDGIDYLQEIIETLKRNNDKVILTGINAEVEEKIKHTEFYKKKVVENKIYARTSEAISQIYGGRV